MGLGKVLYVEVFNYPTRMCRVASEHALSVESEALSQVLFSTAMSEEIDRKVQEAVDRA